MRESFASFGVVLALGWISFPSVAFAQEGGPGVAQPSRTDRGAQDSPFLPSSVSGENFSELREHSPFLRTLNLSKSLILTGVATIEGDAIATLLDLETRETYVVSKEANGAGWSLVGVKGDESDIESLTAQVKVAGSEVVSIRYAKSPSVSGTPGVSVSTRIGDGSRGGGTGPHGGPDPRVLTPDQLSDARNAARNIKAGFQADGYADNQTIPPEVVSKISKLSVQQRESINVKMFEYRNRGVSSRDRIQIYNRLLDREVSRR
ncbi:MAG: hypothetical protein P1U85_16670 [Verrucomicrobiales bacterium]|nr:hypothetical protein [Verrucomicrobiales bacterium]